MMTAHPDNIEQQHTQTRCSNLISLSAETQYGIGY
jgi:hypothetical protein